MKKSLALFFLVLSAGIAVSLLRYSGFQVSTIEIRGVGSLSDARIRESLEKFLAGSHAFLLPKSSYFLISPRILEERIEREFIRVSRASVVKTFPDFLEVTVEERMPWALVCNDQFVSSGQESDSSASLACFYIDETGFVYAEAPESSGTLLTKITGDQGAFSLGTYAFDQDTLHVLALLGKRAKSAAGISVIGYELRAALPDDIRVLTDRGFALLFKKEDDFENVFSVLRRVLDEEIKDRYDELEYIDLRFGNKVFYKFR